MSSLVNWSDFLAVRDVSTSLDDKKADRQNVTKPLRSRNRYEIAIVCNVTRLIPRVPIRITTSLMKPRIIVVTRSKNGRQASIRKSVEEFKNESRWSLVVELLLFGLLAAISAWPMIHAAEALRLL
jgi:hypothetical protein